jgi:hypothetical protein
MEWKNCNGSPLCDVAQIERIVEAVLRLVAFLRDGAGKKSGGRTGCSQLLLRAGKARQDRVNINAESKESILTAAMLSIFESFSMLPVMR